MSDGSLPFGKDAKPEYPEVAKRVPLSKFEFATLFLKQGGKCARCSEELKPGRIRDEHLHALHLGGGNELTNRALWCLDCTKPKDRQDKAAIAKSKRLRGETCNGPKKKIQSRGFQPSMLPTRESRDGKTWQKAEHKYNWPKRKFPRSTRAKPARASQS